MYVLTRPSGERHEFTVMSRGFNPSTIRPYITEALSLHIKAVSITADKARIYLLCIMLINLELTH